MREYKKHILILLLFVLTAGVSSVAQFSTCPDNIDFEFGNLNNWECKTGKVESLNGVNTVTWLSTGENPNHHKIIKAATAGTDPYGGFPEACPNGSAYSVKLGNNFFTTASAEGMSYTFHIPDAATVYSILFYYAVVFQDPQHNPDEQPRFRAKIYNVTDNEVVNCSDFDFTASASLPGFRVSASDPKVIYKDWTPVTLNLNGYAGKTIKLEFITSDCTFTGHFGYAYIDVSSSCSGAITGNVICPEATHITLTAPYGFQHYTWYADNTYTTVLSNLQTMTLQPVPPAGATFPVIVQPYPGFGCTDTIMATIRNTPAPVANAGPDVEVCDGLTAMIGDQTDVNNNYTWTPAALLTNAAVSNPLTVNTIIQPTEFYLVVTDKINGCKSYDTVKVTPVKLNNSLIVTGDSIFCNNAIINTQLKLSPTDGNIKWFENGNEMNGANTILLNPRPAGTSIYYASIQKDACLAITRTIEIKKLKVPQVDFSTDVALQCLNSPVTFTNKTTSLTNSDIIQWRVSDGRILSAKDINLTFPVPGEYKVLLKVTSAEGCADSLTKKIQVVEKCGLYMPSAFTPGADGKNDQFGPVINGLIKLNRFSVYDRNGTVVYTTQTAGEKWDGKYKGKLLPSAVYVWMLEYESSDNKKVMLKGTVTLIR